MILKFSQGGVFSPPFAIYQPDPIETPKIEKVSKKESESESESKKNGDEDYDFIQKVIKDLDGLPSDMINSIDKLSYLFKQIRTDMARQKVDPYYIGSVESNYLKLLTYISQIKYNKEQLDEARKTAINNNSLSEVVVNDLGLTMVTNGETFAWITPEEYHKNSDKYMLVTNNRLLNLRAEKTPFNNTLIDTVNTGVSMKQINNTIKDIIDKLGLTESKTNMFTSSEKGYLIRGIDEFKNAIEKSNNYDADVNELYELNILDENLANQADAALSYIYNTLATNERALLKLKSDGTDNGAKKLIGQLITSKVSNKSYNILSKIKEESGSDSNSNESKIKANFAYRVINGLGGIEAPITIDTASGSKMSTITNYYGDFKDSKNETISEKSIGNNLIKSGLMAYIKNPYAITFGNTSIDMNLLDEIIYNKRGLTRAILPKTTDGKVRFDVLDEYLNIVKGIPLNDETKLKEALRNSSLSDLLDNDKLDMNKFGLYLLISGKISVPGNNDPFKDNKTVVKLEGSNKLDSEFEDFGIDVDSDYWGPAWGNDSNIYEGVVYIPIHTNPIDSQNMSENDARIQNELARISGQKSINIEKERDITDTVIKQIRFDPINFSADSLLNNE